MERRKTPTIEEEARNLGVDVQQLEQLQDDGDPNFPENGPETEIDLETFDCDVCIE